MRGTQEVGPERHAHERIVEIVAKRYPSNEDSIGIELVGKFDEATKKYETVTSEQNESLKWLVRELITTLRLQATEVFRHPTVSYKRPTEALSADWR